MILNQSIPRYNGTKVCISREDFDAFCDGNRCAGNLISYFEFWNDIKYACAYKKVAEGLQEEVVEQDLYQHQSIPELIEGIRHSYEKDYVRDAITLLIDKGVLKIIEEANHNRNQARTYLFNPEPVKNYVDEHFSCRERKIAHDLEFRERKIATTNIKSKDNKLDSKESSKVTDVTGARLLRRSLLKQGTGQALSKEPVAEPVEKEELDLNKPKLVRRKPLLFPSKEVESLYLHWNSKQGLTTHSLDPNKTIFVSSVKYLVKHLNKYTVDQVKQAIDDYYLMLLDEDLIPDINFQWSKTSLAGFFEGFNSYQTEAFSNQNCMGGVDSWFGECIKGIDHLKVKFGKPVKHKQDYNPEVTKNLAQLYRDKINKDPFTPHQINMLIDVANDLVNFHTNMKNRLTFNSNPNEKNSVVAFSHYVIDALIYRNDIAKIQVFWMRGDFFKVKLPEYFKKLGMLDSSYQGTSRDLLSEDQLTKSKTLISDAKEKYRNDCKIINDSDINEEEKKEKKELLYSNLKTFIDQELENRL